MKRPTIGYTLGAILIIGAAILITWEMRSQAVEGHPGTSFYSDDDGQTYFRDSLFKFPPFDHNGHPADRAMVYSYDKGTFVGFLQRYTPTSLKLLTDEYNRDKVAGQSTDSVEKIMTSRDMMTNGSLLKLPGSRNKWMPAAQFSPNAVKSPNDSAAELITP